MTADEIMALIRASGKPHYVYVLRRPNGEPLPFYVGVGTGRRLLDHEIFAKRPNMRSHKLGIIRKIWAVGGSVDYTVHAWFETRQAAEQCEAELVGQIGRRDIGTGPLSNLTAGGEGASAPSDELRAIKSKVARVAWETRDRLLPHLNNAETRAKATASRIGRKRGVYNWTTKPGPKEHQRAAYSERMKADPPSRRPGVAAKMAATKLGKPIENHWTKDPARKELITRGAHPRARPIEIKGQRFECIEDAREQLGVCRATVEYWLRRGMNGARRISDPC